MHQLHPLQVDSKTNEVFLRLPPPHDNIILTPPRESDAPIITEYLNDPRIYATLEGPPNPYLLEHAHSWLASVTKECDAILNELREAENSGKESEAGLIVVGGCPVRSLREVRDDGSDLFIGDIVISRAGRFNYLRDAMREEELKKHNESLPVGDPEIIWDFGDYLAASHHRKGIMSSALRTIMHEWAIPRMNAHRIFGLTFEGNYASAKVFEKNGFAMLDMVPDCVDIPESKGGGKVGMRFLEWRRSV